MLAKAIVGLNDCKENSEFALFTQKAANKNGLKWMAGVNHLEKQKKTSNKGRLFL